MIDDFGKFLTRKESLFTRLVRSMVVKRRQQEAEEKRLQSQIEMQLDTWWFHHQDLPRTPENQKRAIFDVLEYLTRQQEAELGDQLDF